MVRPTMVRDRKVRSVARQSVWALLVCMDPGLGPNKLSRSVGLWVGLKDWPIEPRSESCDRNELRAIRLWSE